MEQKDGKIVVGMSGGVDSSLTALLLKQAGYRVHGLFMRCWEDDDGNCPAGADAVAAAATADAIGIELDVVDLVSEYKKRIFSEFIALLRAGYTPNPDVWCNSVIKFSEFRKIAIERYGATVVATGHYARIDRQCQRLLKAEDGIKDQTYFLHRLQSKLFDQIMFPLGELHKRQVKQQALQAKLPTATRKESMGICFIGKRPFREFIAEYIEPRAGEIVDENGKSVGSHQGAHLYTIGQRSGLGISSPTEPWYVAQKDIEKNTITVVRGREHPLLYSRRLKLAQMSWVNQPPPPDWVLTCRIRHQMEVEPCTLQDISENEVTVVFARPQWAAALGQAAVLYDGIECLGGGTIMTASID